MAARASKSVLYFDDRSEDGDWPSPKTSHPSFVRVCKGAFFYDCGDEFAPFGSDAGSDTLAALEDWFRKPRPRRARAFITQMIKEWDMTIPNLLETREPVVRRWLADEEIAMVLPEIDQLVIATAFGQYKIAGTLDDDIRELAIAANTRETISTAYYRVANPKWSHAKQKAKADQKIRAALDAMT